MMVWRRYFKLLKGLLKVQVHDTIECEVGNNVYGVTVVNIIVIGRLG